MAAKTLQEMRLTEIAEILWLLFQRGIKKFGAHMQSTVLIGLCLGLGLLCNTGQRIFSM